jgi:hypothetical protein
MFLFGSGRDVTDVYEMLGQAERSCEDQTWPSIDRRCLTQGGAGIERALRVIATDRVVGTAVTEPDPEPRPETVSRARRTISNSYEAIAQLTPSAPPSETGALEAGPRERNGTDASEGHPASLSTAGSEATVEAGQTAPAQQREQRKSVEAPSVSQQQAVERRSTRTKRAAKRTERRLARQWQRGQVRAQQIEPGWSRQAHHDRARAVMFRSWQDVERRRMARHWGEPAPGYPPPPRQTPYVPFGHPLYWRF